MSTARIVAIIFSFVNMLGLFWFLDSLVGSTVVFGALSIICALAVALAPRENVRVNTLFRNALLVLCLIGVGALVMLIAQDYQRTYGPDIGAITLRAIFAASFIFMAIEISGKK